MKKIKKLFTFALLLCILLAIFSSQIIFAINVEAKEASAQKNLQSLHKSLIFKEEFMTISITKNTQTSNLQYPDNFGGIYIDDNNDLRILYTENKYDFTNKISENDAIFEKVLFSFNYLSQIYKYLSSIMGEFDINTVYIDERLNRVVITASNSALNSKLKENVISHMQNNFYKFNSDVILFKESHQITTTAPAGTSISMPAGIGTLGYTAYKASTGEYGFVTCAHGTNDIGEHIYKLDGTLLGTVVDRCFRKGYRLDAAFVSYTNQNEKSYNYLGQGTITHIIPSSSLAIGMSISKYGHTTHKQFGTIVSTSCSASVMHNGKKIILIDQIEVSITHDTGDSGSPLLHSSMVGPVIDENDRPFSIIGIATLGEFYVDAYGEIIHPAQIAYATKAENIHSEFGLSAYLFS